MRKPVKIVLGALGGLVLLVAGVFVAALVTVVRDNLPADSPRSVETADYTFDAPDGWITACADRAPGCLAVASSNRQWSDREYWIEAGPVATDVADGRLFEQRAHSAAASVIGAQLAKPESLVAIGDSAVTFEGTEVLDFEHSGGVRFARFRFVRLPDGKMLQFTCYGEQPATAQEHDGACAAALDGLHFPAAAAAEEERLANEPAGAAAEEEPLTNEPAAENPQADDDDEAFATQGSSDPNSFFNLDNARRLFNEREKYAEKLEKQRAATESKQ